MEDATGKGERRVMAQGPRRLFYRIGAAPGPDLTRQVAARFHQGLPRGGDRHLRCW